jgi:hypothetical protein
LTATWLGHTVEYVRVFGSRGVWTQLAGSAHLYMAPVGTVLAALALLGAARWRRRGRELSRRLEFGRAALWGRNEVTTQPSNPVVVAGAPSGIVGLGHEWAALLIGQLVVYTVQENVESLSVHGRAPGLGVLTGVHWAAPLIHAGIALIVATGLVLLQRRRLGLVRDVDLIERLVARRWAIRLPLPALTTFAGALIAPHRRWGRQRWQRPPPVTLAA